MSHLPQRRFGVDARPIWKPEALWKCRVFCSWPATEAGDTGLVGIGFWGKTPQWEWARASERAHASRSFGHLVSRVSFAEDLIVDDSGALTSIKLPVLAKGSSLIEVLPLGGPTSRFTNCGHNSRWLPAVWILTWLDLAMRCWLVIVFSVCLRIHVHWLFGAVF